LNYNQIYFGNILKVVLAIIVIHPFPAKIMVLFQIHRGISVMEKSVFMVSHYDITCSVGI
jgi:hypothetical protein